MRWRRRDEGEIDKAMCRSKEPGSCHLKECDPAAVIRTHYPSRRLHERMGGHGFVSAKESPYFQVGGTEEDDKCRSKKTRCKITWADHLGLPLAPTGPVREPPLVEDKDDRDGPAFICRTKGESAVKAKSYKEAFLGQCTQPPSPSHPKQRRQDHPSLWRTRSSAKAVGRCFKCLASDHWARDCRDPWRCARCWGSGHLACNCRSRGAKFGGKMQGGARFRPHSQKVFVPLTEGFRIRQQQGRRAVITITCGAANLGHFPQGTIANDLAERFGGFSNDFLVARFRERDFVIFLPQWVQPEELIRRDGIRLAHCRIRCFVWNPHRDAVRDRLTYKVWIKLVNLPFEC